MNKDDLQVIQDRLVDIYNGFDRIDSVGICANLSNTRLNIEFEKTVSLNARNWKYFSGDRHYPVPSGDPEISPMQMYNNCDFDKMYTGNYGQMRLNLVEYLIELINKGKFKIVQR